MAEPLEAPMPMSLDLQANYSLQVAAVDPTTGNAVSGVTVGATVITADPVAVADVTDLATGDWFLVPGPRA